MFSKDINHFPQRTPRSLAEAFGPYSSAKLHVPRRKSRVVPVLWMLAYGVGVGVLWFFIYRMRTA